MEEILNHTGFKQTLATLAEQYELPITQVNSDARRYLKELYTVHSPIAEMGALYGVESMLARGYDRTIDVNPNELKQLTKLMRRNSVAFVTTHKTYIDLFVLGVVLRRHGLPLPYTFSGINMSFMGFGQLGRQVGSIFIRRSFKDNHVYKATLRHFIASLVDDNAHFMWAIEGTRSRTGKQVWPRLGILKYIAEGAAQTSKPVKYVPVSIVYDLIPDVKHMTEEGRGEKKQAESLAWFVNYVRTMGDSLGRIALRFGEPIEFGEEDSGPEIESIADLSAEQQQLPRVAFELAYQIDRITPVTTTSLVCASLLGQFSTSKTALENDVSSLMKLIESHKQDALVDRGQQIGASVQSALKLLINADIVTRQNAGIDATYAIKSDSYLPAVYYANMAIHHLVNRSFIELATVTAGNKRPADRMVAFWHEIMALRDLFKFEFFYSRREAFSDEVESDLELLDGEWAKLITGRSAPSYQLLRKNQPLVSHAVLYPYVEAYRVVAHGLESWDPERPFDESTFIDHCLKIGAELHWQGNLRRVEAVSKPFLLNGLRVAQNRQLVPANDDQTRTALAEFAKQLDDVAERLQTIQNIAVAAPQSEEHDVPLEYDIVPGSRSERVVADVLASEKGAHIGAFFDLDRTLIDGFSAKEFFQNRLLSGRMGAREIAAQFAGVVVYAMGNGNFAGLAAVGARGVQGTKESVFIEVGEEVYQKHLAQAIFPESRALVAAHMAQGHTVAIISAAMPYQVDPIARDLNIKHIMCTRMEVKDGVFTGNIVEPPCWGDGKAYAAQQLAAEHELDLGKSYFYTDSAEDMPLLEIVGNPRPLNPDTRLSTVAFQNDWPIYRFNDEGRPGITNLIRTGLLAGSMIPATLAGIASGARNVSWQDGANAMMAAAGDLGTAMAGIKLVVKGEENLWAQRPAVFIFNHQSSADLFIGAKLLRKDARGIAKQELKYTPLGPLMMAAGVVFIDRRDREKAIEALRPAVEALKQGTSIAIAPEGTRSYDYRLGKFKKGAFHLAMQARVPIVPLIIRNAHDAMPRGSALVRPTVVEVVVGKPISTDDWNAKNLVKKIAAVRQLYLDELGQIE